MREVSPVSVGKVLLVGAQLGLLILIIRLFEVQNLAFQDVSLLVLFGFLVHSFLPMRFRLKFFLALSLASIVMVLGVKSGVWVIGLGLGLIGICYLPIRFSARVALILLAGGVLAALRVDWLSAPWAVGVWPIFSAMFMFRLIIYLYDIKHEKGSPDLIRTLSYFFMLPNVVFPLFPVVDYKKFQRSYYNEDAERIYQRGVSWIFRGVIHLLLYRVVYQHLTIDPVNASGLVAVMQFSFSAFLLYLQVSGSFHMIVGILLLFGFNLPETNHLYFLASSFNDFWRRINIYWKDFMMKVFYYPVYFRAKKLGETKAIIISTLAVFFATWCLHAYQWFWLRGVFLLEWNDALYWALLSVLVIGNSLYETKYGRDRKLGAYSRTFLDHAALVCSTLATFLTMGLLWGMWSTDSLVQWVSMWSTTGVGWLVMLLVIPGLFLSSRLLANLAKRRRKEVAPPPRKLAVAPPVALWRKGLVYAGFMGLIFVVGHETVYSKLPSGAAAAVEAFRVVQLSARDEAQLERGYYENLIGNRHGTELWGVLAEKPYGWGWTWEMKLLYTRATNDMRRRQLLPNVQFTLKNGAVTSNRWGMRDQDYEKEKPANTVRIALLGASHVFGSGVDNEEIFENVLEQKLNARGDGMRFEILNFAYPSRDVLSQLPTMELDVLQFEPDVVLYIEHPGAARRLMRNLAQFVTKGADIPYDYLQSIIKRADVSEGMPIDKVRNRLAPYADEMLKWAYETLVAINKENGIRPLWVHLPEPHHRYEPGDPKIAADAELAERAGFTLISLIDVYEKYPARELILAQWDRHPNARGHQLVAERLYDIFSDRSEELLGVASGSLVRATN